MSFDRTVLLMAGIRMIFAAVIFIAALLMLKFNSVPQALRINAFLGLIGPMIMVAVSILGIADMAGEVSWTKLGIIILGVILIIYGTGK